jgi:hypothetical protein
MISNIFNLNEPIPPLTVSYNGLSPPVPIWIQHLKIIQAKGLKHNRKNKPEAQFCFNTSQRKKKMANHLLHIYVNTHLFISLV